MAQVGVALLVVASLVASFDDDTHHTRIPIDAKSVAAKSVAAKHGHTDENAVVQASAIGDMPAAVVSAVAAEPSAETPNA